MRFLGGFFAIINYQRLEEWLTPWKRLNSLGISRMGTVADEDSDPLETAPSASGTRISPGKYRNASSIERLFAAQSATQDWSK